ncbi:MAG: hypothetical protein P8P30_08650 [Rickettsiales bacterium]|nr:hypothetical protein [Rickettsiales bacterium]
MANSIPFQLVKDNPSHLPRLLDLQDDLQKRVSAFVGGEPAPIIKEAINAAICESYALAVGEV